MTHVGAVFLFVIMVLGGLLLLIIYFLAYTKRSRYSKLLNFIGQLEDLNYKFKELRAIKEIRNHKQKGVKEILFSKIPRFVYTKNSVEFTITQDSIGTGNSSVPAIKISCTMPINPNFYLKITKRGFLSKLFGINKGEYHGLNEEYNAECNNLMIAKLLFNNPDNLQILINLVENQVPGNNAPFEIRNGKTANKVKYSHKDIFMLKTEALLLLSNVIGKISRKYKIDSSIDIASVDIDDDLKLLTLSEIEFLSPVCVICYQVLIEDIAKIQQEVMGRLNYQKQVEQVLYLVCCSSFVHEDHHVNWIKKQNICPYCKFNNPDTDPVFIRDQ